MPFNGNGVFSLVAGNPVVTGTVISSTVQNNTMSDIATALTDCVTRDGQSPPTQNLPMGGLQITGLGNATTRGAAVNAGQIQDGGLTTLTSVSGADTITANSVPIITAYTSGQTFDFIPTAANLTNAVTINIDALGAQNITKFGALALSPGDLVPGEWVKIRYDGTQFQILTPTIGAISGRNRIINGNCNISQRGSITLTAGTAGYGGPDRFYAINAGTAGGSFTQSASSMTISGRAQPCVLQTVNTTIANMATTNYWQGIQQIIEGVNVFDLLGKPITISFWFRATVTGTYSFALADGGSTNSFVSTFSAVANTPVKIVIPVATLPTTLNITNSNIAGLYVIIGALNTGTFSTATLNSWQTGNHFSATTLTNWGTAGNSIAVTELQLEAGSVATPYEELSYGLQLALCFRYYWQQQVVSNCPVGVGQALNTTTAYILTNLPVVMRGNPTAAAPAGMFRLGGEQVSSASFVGTTTQSILFTVQYSTTPFAAGNAVLLLSGSSPTLPTLTASAEL